MVEYHSINKKLSINSIIKSPAWKMQLVARTAYGFFKTWNDYLQFKLIDFPDMLQIQFKVIVLMSYLQIKLIDFPDMLQIQFKVIVLTQ